MDSVAEGEGRRADGEWWMVGDRYQTISADHHNIGGSTAAWLVERRVLASGIIVSPINRINGTKKYQCPKERRKGVKQPKVKRGE